MEVQLMSVSPVSFMMASEGDLVEIRRKPPKFNEYRGTLEAATESFLIFKGQTKIGMIPTDYFKENDKSTLKKKCRIIKMDQRLNIIIVDLLLNKDINLSR